MNRKVALVSAGIGAALLSLGPLAYASTLQSLQSQEAQAQAQLAQEQAAYNQTQNSINATMAAIGALNNDLNAARQKIGSTGQQIVLTDSHIAATQALLIKTQSQLNQTRAQLNATRKNYSHTVQVLIQTKKALIEQTHLLKGQLRLIEERGSVGYLDVVLGAHSFSDFISRVSILGRVASAAAQEVQVMKQEEIQQKIDEANLAREKAFLTKSTAQLAQRQALLASENALLQREKAQAVALRAQAVSAAASAQTSLSQRNLLMGQLKSQQSALAANMQSLQSQIATITTKIEGLLGQFSQGYISRRQLFNAMYPLVQPIAFKDGLPPALVIAVITQESGGNAKAISGSGAVGLMQIEPATAQWIAKAAGLSPTTIDSELQNPEDNLMIGCFYLGELIHGGPNLPGFGGNTELALAAYNAGPGAVQGLVSQYGNSFPAIAPHLPLQTQQYVPSVEGLYSQYSSMPIP